MIDRDEGLLDADEDAAELAGLRAAAVELKREVAVLRRNSIDLVAENASLRGQLVQERVFIRAMADDVAAAG
jgi:hypothetical protein